MRRVDLESFELVLLRRPGSAPDYPQPELERIQRERLAYLAQLREAGQIATYGPVIDPQGDPSLRGMATGPARWSSLGGWPQPTRPSAPAGWLDIMAWYCPPGTMSRPGHPLSVD